MKQAEHHLRQAIAAARAQSARDWALGAVVSLAPLLIHQGREAEARSLLEDMITDCEEGFDQRLMRSALGLLAQTNADSEDEAGVGGLQIPLSDMVAPVDNVSRPSAPAQGLREQNEDY